MARVMKSVVISQPQLLPWPGFFELVASADIYVHLDDAQFSRGGFINRVQIKHPAGSKWMTVPLKGRGSFQEINHVEAVGTDWKRQHRELVCQSLAQAPHLDLALAVLDAVYAADRLVELLMASIELPAARMGFRRPKQWMRSSKLGLAGTSWERVLAIVKAVGGTHYVTAHGAANYLDHQAFESAGVDRRLHGLFKDTISAAAWRFHSLCFGAGPDSQSRDGRAHRNSSPDHPVAGVPGAKGRTAMTLEFASGGCRV